MKIETILDKRNGEWDYVHDEIIDRMGDLEVDCPECENVRHDDDQYQCCTCRRTDGKINVLSWIKEQIKNSTP